MSEISSIYFGNKAVQSIETKNGIMYGGGDPFEYEAVDGGYAVTGFKKSLVRKRTYPTNISIPESHNDQPVVEIRDNAFRDLGSLEQIFIPASVKRVRGFAFSYCYATVTLDEACNFEFIGHNCFTRCSGFSTLRVNGIIAGQLEYFTDLTSVIGNYRFQDGLSLQGDSKLISINLESVTTINMNGMQYVGLQEVNIPNCTNIGYRAFYHNTTVKTLYLSTSTISFGSYCFSGTTLEEVHCKASDISQLNKSYFKRVYLIGNDTSVRNNMLYNCSKLEELIINNGCLTLGNSMCYGCSALTHVIIPNSVTTIEYCAFYGCSSLTNITIPNSVTSIQSSSFENCSKLEDIVLPSGLTSIKSGTFGGCSKLEDIVIPDGVASIGDHAFNGCSSITELVLPDSIVSVASNALNGCESLIEISSPIYDNKLEAITNATNLQELYLTSGTEVTSAMLFRKLNSLRKVILAPSIVSIGDNAFNGCANLSDFTFENVQTIGDYAFYRAGLTKIENLNSLIMLGESAFYECPNLTFVDLSSSVSLITLKGSTFRGCLNLNTVYFPSGLERIEAGVFKECASLSELSLPSSLTYLGANCFYGDYNLHKVIINSPSIEIDTKCFAGSSSFLEVYNLSSTVIDSSYDYTLTDPFWYGKIDPICPIIVHTSLEEPSSVEYFGNYIIGFVDGVGYYLLGVKDKDLTPSDCVLPKSIEFRGATINSYEIGDFAFYKNKKLISVSIPRSVPKIRQFSFTSAQNLETVSLEGDLELDNGGFANTKLSQIDFTKITSFGRFSFQNTKITEAVLKEGVTTIPLVAFSGSKLRTITLPTTLETIGDGGDDHWCPFYQCNHLVEIINKSSLTLHIGKYRGEGLIGQHAIVIRTTSFESTITNDADYWYLIEGNEAYLFDVTSSNVNKTQNVPQNVTFKGNVFEVGVIWSYAFSAVDNKGYGYEVVETINVPPTVKNLGENVFYGLRALKAVTGLNNVETVGKSAFYDCKALTAVSLPSVMKIPDSCFVGCEALSTINLSQSIVSIGDSAFYNCGLVEFSIPEGITAIPRQCFDNCKKLLSVNIPQSVTSFGESAFFGCELLSEILIPESVTSISNSCFSEDKNLLSISVPQSVKYLGQSVFNGCSRLSEVVFHEGILAFDNSLFYRCVALTTMDIPQSVTRFGDNVFYGASALTSTNYNGTIEQFNSITKSSNWLSGASLATVHCTDGDITL